MKTNNIVMAQYIDKTALVAEIKERIETYNKGYANGDDRRADALEILLHDLNTLEVKEVDLEKEIDNVWNPHFNLGWDDDSLVSINHKSFESIARHFFELGLKAYFGAGFAIEEPCFRELAQPLVEYLRKNYHPHARIIIEDDGAEIVVGVLGEPFPIE